MEPARCRDRSGAEADLERDRAARFFPAPVAPASRFDASAAVPAPPRSILIGGSQHAPAPQLSGAPPEPARSAADHRRSCAARARAPAQPIDVAVVAPERGHPRPDGSRAIFFPRETHAKELALPTPKNDRARRIHPASTGIEPVDRELRRRGPFASAEEAESMAVRLMATWRALTQPGSNDAYIMLRSRKQRSER
jgi:hypothetical protein